MNTVILVLGNQLFPIRHYQKLNTNKVLMIEDHGLCTHFRYHKHKIILFLSSMREYAKELKRNKFTISYYDGNHELFKESYEQKLDHYFKKNKSIKKIITYSIEDKFFEKRIVNYCNSKNIQLETIESPMFLTSRNEFKQHLNLKKRPFMKSFYEWQRKRLNIMMENKKPTGGKWSYDQENRKKLPKDITIPQLPPIKPSSITKQVSSFVDTNFKDHPGYSENFWLPVTRIESLKWLDNFIKERLENFGSYQDAITNENDFVFHSVLSPMINMGLLLPEEICHKVIQSYNKSPEKYPLNSVEGFIRQVIGWREFVRGIYQVYSEKQDQSNFWNHKRRLKECWYQGTTGIPVLDDAINKAKKYGYNHHIERLMIISNIMLLSEVHPKEVYKWFMEMSVDSSDWVMGPNVYGMGQFSDGGIFATKPYICGSNYYLKMSRYKKGEWCEVLDGLYWRFIHKHQDFYKRNPRMAIMVKSLEKMDPSRKENIFQKAKDFIIHTTHI